MDSISHNGAFAGHLIHVTTGTITYEGIQSPFYFVNERGTKVSMQFSRLRRAQRSTAGMYLMKSPIQILDRATLHRWVNSPQRQRTYQRLRYRVP